MKKILIGMLIAFVSTVILCGASYLFSAYIKWEWQPIEQGFRVWFLLCAIFGIAAGVFIRFDDKKRKR